MELDFSKIHTYKNGNLYAKEYEIEISISALRELIENDEKSILSIQNEFKKFLENIIPKMFLFNKEIILKNI